MENSEAKYWYLRNHQLFKALSNAEISELCIITRYITAKKNDYIYFANDHVPRIYLLKKGMIKILEVEEGKETIRDIIKQGDLFGEVSLAPNSTSNELAQAMSKEVYICSFKLEDFEKVLAKNPDIALSYSKLVGAKLMQLSNRYNDLMFKDVKTRLLTFLKQIAIAEGEKRGSSWVLKNYLTHSDIANLICASRQTVTQLINELEFEKKLKYTRSEIVLKDF